MSEIPETARDILKRIRRLELSTRRLVDTAFAGQYHSVFKGRGMNFEEVREYQPGDEIRTIDWNVTARTGRPHIKQFTEERELSVMLLVDVSASGEFGSRDRSKRELAAEVAALLAFSAIRNNDRVGLLLFSDHVELYLPPRNGRSHVLRLIREVLFFKPKGCGTDAVVALDYLNRVVPKRSVVFLLSDFLVTGIRRKLAVTAKRHDLVAIPVLDPRELTLPDIGTVNFEDAETGEQIELQTSNAGVRNRFAEAARQRLEELTRLLSGLRIDAITLRTGEDYLPPLRAFFEHRESRIG